MRKTNLREFCEAKRAFPRAYIQLLQIILNISKAITVTSIASETKLLWDCLGFLFLNWNS